MALKKEAVVQLMKKGPLKYSTMVSVIKSWNIGLSEEEIATELDKILKEIPFKANTLHGNRVLTLKK